MAATSGLWKTLNRACKPSRSRRQLFNYGRDNLDAVVLTAGDDSLSAAVGSLDLKAAKTTRAPISLRVGLSKLLPLADEADPTILELSKSALEGGRDEIAFEVASQPNGVSIRLEIQEGILKLVGMIGAARAGQ